MSSNPYFRKSRLLLSACLYLSQHIGLFSGASFVNTTKEILSSFYPNYLSLSYLRTQIMSGLLQFKCSSSLSLFLHLSLPKSCVSLLITLTILFLKTLNFVSSNKVGGQVSHPYKTIGRIILQIYHQFCIPKKMCEFMTLVQAPEIL